MLLWMGAVEAFLSSLLLLLLVVVVVVDVEPCSPNLEALTLATTPTPAAASE
jgi:hypothetical protein